MKKGFKKMVTGLCLGAVMLTGGLTLSGCTADITVNQEEIDEVVENLNEFLENQNGMYNTSIETLVDNLTIYLQNQNNFNSDEIDALIENLNKYLEENNGTKSEDVKDILDGYVFSALEKSLYSTSFKVTSNSKEYDAFGNIYFECDSEYKYYTDGNIIKEYFNEEPVLDDYNIYRETTIDENNKYDMKTYYVRGNYKYWHQDNNRSEIYPISNIWGIHNYAGAVYFIYNMLADPYLIFNTFVMETEGDVVTFKTSFIEEDVYIINKIQVEFTNGDLTKIIIEENDHGEYVIRTEMNFQNNIGDFVFDATGFKEETPQ